MIFLQAAARPSGPSAALLELVEGGHNQLLISIEVLEEICDVLCRPELTAKFKTLTSVFVAAFLEKLEYGSELIRDVPRTFIYDRDPKDEKYVNLAIAGQADFLVSRDRDLLDLDRTIEIRSKEGASDLLNIVDPITMLQLLRNAQ